MSINIKNVSKVYPNSVTALKSINLNINTGEFVFITGASGSGKSTLLKLIMKEEEVTSGKIRVFGADLVGMKKKKVPFYRRTMGIVFQDFRIIESMTVFQNIELVMRVVGASSRAIRKRVPYVLSLFSMEDKADRYPRELSGGEKQRVGIARALVNNPNLIIADEPTGNIDPSMSYEIMDLLAQINKRGTTVLVVTHDMSVAKKFDFRTIEINKGKIIQDTSSPKSGIKISSISSANFLSSIKN